MTAQFFLCHAGADKESVVLPFCRALEAAGLSYWLDKTEIRWGDRIVTRVQEGLRRAQYAIVFISPAFMRRRWPLIELDAALSMEISGRAIVLPLIIGSERRVLAKYPFLEAKRCERWDMGIEYLITRLMEIMEDDRNANMEAAGSIEALPELRSIRITDISFGEGASRIHYGKSDLLELPAGTVLPTEYVPYDGQERHVLKNLLKEPIADAAARSKVFVPRTFSLSGKKRGLGTKIAVFVCTDVFYVFASDHRIDADSFEVSGVLGRGGIAEFVDKAGEVQNWNKYIVGDGIGGAGVLTAVEFREGKPVGRSPFVLVVRKGIRYPDDVWRSQQTGKPIVSEQGDDISTARFLFESRQPNGMSTDIFIADFNGARMCNLTLKDETAYDGLFNDQGEEIAKWVDARTVQYCSMREGLRQIVRRTDCIFDSVD